MANIVRQSLIWPNTQSRSDVMWPSYPFLATYRGTQPLR